MSGGGRRGARAFVALGANLGDRAATLAAAIERVAAVDGVAVVRRSAVYETPAVGPPQPDYLNAVVELETTLGPEALLAALHGIERAFGRVRAERWGPRTLDLDLLWYAGVERSAPAPVLPHPHAHERAFVLVPLCELAPDLPLRGITAAAHLAALPAADRAAVRRVSG